MSESLHTWIVNLMIVVPISGVYQKLEIVSWPVARHLISIKILCFLTDFLCQRQNQLSLYHIRAKLISIKSSMAVGTGGAGGAIAPPRFLEIGKI